MILLTSTGPVLGDAIRDGVASHGEAVRSVLTGSAIEAVVAAWGCEAIVYVAGASMLDAQLRARPAADRARNVLHAAAMPGVKLIVGVMPTGEAYGGEEEVLEGGDVPTVILRCAPLIEEVEAAGKREWLREGSRVTTGAMLATTVARALRDTTWQGRKVEVPTIYADGARLTSRPRPRSSVPSLGGLPALAWVA